MLYFPQVKGLDANRYATKKTVAQGMLDIALLTSNASQLKYVLQVGPKHEFYTLLVVLISISIVLQVRNHTIKARLHHKSLGTRLGLNIIIISLILKLVTDHVSTYFKIIWRQMYLMV